MLAAKDTLVGAKGRLQLLVIGDSRSAPEQSRPATPVILKHLDRWHDGSRSSLLQNPEVFM